jgi:hypothetical protein
MYERASDAVFLFAIGLSIIHVIPVLKYIAT